MSLFSSLTGFEPTRKTLHLYANAIGVVPRAHATPHNKWWHVSLRLTSTGLKTAVFNLPNGETGWLEMDLTQHVVRLQTSYGGTFTIRMQAGLTGTEFGDQVLTAVADLGLSADYARAKFEDDEPRTYDPEQAANFFTALTQVHQIFSAHRATLTGQLGPIQLWPHGFDLSFEWFGTRIESHVENGELQAFPAQLNLGFYPGDEPYFYSNPWPFEDKLLDAILPDGAYWHTKGWQGAKLPYDTLSNDQNSAKRLQIFAQSVYELAAPTLIA